MLSGACPRYALDSYPILIRPALCVCRQDESRILTSTSINDELSYATVLLGSGRPRQPGRPRYVMPGFPGYSIEMLPDALKGYTFPEGAVWAGAAAGR